MSDGTQYSSIRTFGGIKSCFVYPIVSQDLHKGSKLKEESPHFDFPLYAAPVTRRYCIRKIYLLLNIFTFGIFSILCHWFPNLFRWMNYCSSTINECDFFLIITKESYYAIVKKNKFNLSNQNSSKDETNLLCFLNCLPSQYKYEKVLTKTENKYQDNDTEIEIIFFSFCGSIYVFDSTVNKFIITIPSLDNRPYSVIRNKIGVLLKSFQRLEHVDDDSSEDSSEFIQEDSSRSNLQLLFGKCSCDIPIVPLLDLVRNEIFHPFFIFQIFAVLVWLRNSYIEYAICIVLITLVSLVNSVYETRCSHIKMNNMSKLEYKVSIISRNSISKDPCERIIDSSDLIPGDLIILRPGMILPCDAIILNSNIVVNEAALTGESVPVLKSPIPKYSCELFDVTKDYKHIVYARTIVMGVQGNNVGGVALVLKIGFSTLQGQFLQSMYCDVITNRLHYQNDKLYQDSMKFVKFCFFAGICGCIITAAIGLALQIRTSTLIFRAFDLFTIVAPPALPATIAAGSTVAVRKLKNKKIACSNPSSVNIAGQVTTVVFDKTGTLTSDGLDAVGCISSIQGGKPYLDGLCTSGTQIPHVLSQAIATCHTISYVDREHINVPINSEINQSLKPRVIVGEPLELCMFEFSGWVLQDNNEDNNEKNIDFPVHLNINQALKDSQMIGTHSNSNIDKLNLNTNLDAPLSESFDFCEQPPSRVVRRYFDRGDNSHIFGSQYHEELEILKVFDFCSKLRRMTVVCRSPSNPTEFIVFCKGSPEQMKTICQAESVPSDIDDFILNYSRCGMRVLGFAVGYLNSPIDDSFSFLEALSRSEAEERLNFIGLMIFANKLRPTTIDVISTLKDANINCLMSTGDHVYTSIAVAQECGILPVLQSPGNSSKKVVIGDTFGSQSGDECIRWTLLTSNYNSVKVFNSIHEIIEKHNFENIQWVVTGQCLRLLHKLHEFYELEFLDLSKVPEKDPNLVHHHSVINYKKYTQRIRNHLNYKNDLPCWLSGNSNVSDSYSYGLGSILIDTDDGEEFIKLKNIPYHLNCTRNQKKTNVILDTSINNDLERMMILNFDTTIQDIPFSIRMSVLEFIVRYCHVYSRMTPEDKAMHINYLQKLRPNPIVGMCGDGNNDILAIQSADIGIAIADHEASIAASFVSNERNIAAVPDILLEGRAALTSTIQSFQYVVLYIFIQFTSVLYLYSKGTNFTDHQYIWCDLIAFLPISIFATLTKTARHLPPELPTYKNILSSNVLIGIFVQCSIQLVFLVTNLLLITKQPEFKPFVVNKDVVDNGKFVHLQICTENTVVFLVSCIQYVSTGIAIHKTRPFRLSLITNKLFSIHVLFLITTTIILLLIPSTLLHSFLNIVTMPDSSSYILFVTFTFNLLTSIFMMKFIMKAIYVREIHDNGPAYFPQFHPLIIPKSKIEWRINTSSS